MYNELEQILSTEKNKKNSGKFSIYPIDQQQNIELTEESNRVKSKVIIQGVSSNDIIQMKCPDNQPWFLNKEYKQICDYILIIPDSRNNKKLKIALCELKKTYSPDVCKDAAYQLKSSIPMADYILSLLKTHFHKTYTVRYDLLAFFQSKRKQRAGIEPVHLSRKKPHIIPSKGKYVRVHIGSALNFKSVFP